MTRRPYTLLLSLLVAAPCAALRAEPLPLLQESFAQDATLRAVSFVDARHGWAVGDRGLVLATRDGGRRWETQTTPVDCSLTGVWFVDSQRGWAVGGSVTPYTHSTRGVVLRTQDGGFSWRVLPTPTLPLLRGVRMFDSTSGVAWGKDSPLAPSGLFRTNNGGMHWQPVGSAESHTWTAGAFASRDRGLLTDTRRAPCTASQHSVEDHQPAPLDTPPLLAATLANNGVGWLAGAAGTVVMTDNAGSSWHVPRGLPRGAAFQACDWRAVAARGEKVWVAGSPGSLVLHSPDNGDTWQPQPTGVTAPIFAVTFLDERRGWAVGALGTILSTNDGGSAWRVQRRGGSRMAALVISATCEEAPLELMAKIGAAEGYRTAGVALFACPADAPVEEQRFRAAVAGVGATHGELCWRFPLSRSQQDTAGETLDQLLWDQQGTTPGETHAGQDQLADYFATLLAETRPDVVLVAESAQRGLAKKMESALLRAASDQAQQRLAVLGLSPWKPKRVLRVMRDAEGAFDGLAIGDYDSQLGTSLGQWTQPWRGLTRQTPSAPPERIAWTTLAGAPAPLSARRDPLAGIVLQRDSGERRGHALAMPSGLAPLKAAAQRREAFDKLAEATTGGADWANRAVQLTGGLDKDSGAHHLLRLAAEYRSAGRSRLAADAAYLLARRYADHPLSEHALVALMRHYSSTETAHAAMREFNRNLSTAPLANVPAGLGGLAANQQWSHPLTLEEHHDRALKLGDYARNTRPMLHAEPEVHLLLSAAARKPGELDTSVVRLKPLTGPQTPAPWRRCAFAEEWLNKRGPRAPKPALTAALAKEQPLLDGLLNDSCWGNSSGATIHGTTAQAKKAVVKMAYDERHLYLALRCEKLPGAAYPVARAARPRDAELSGYDRVCVRIDIDRDYQTAYELTLDCRGFLHDACAGDPTWNPTWYVATRQDETTWTAEAAIPIEELTGATVTPDSAWVVSLDRSAPGRVTTAWTKAPCVDGSPDAFGLLLFDAGSVASREGQADATEH